MNAELREHLRHLIDAHKRAERAHILAMAKGKGRCRGCGERHEDYNLGCAMCRDRWRFRQQRGTAA